MDWKDLYNYWMYKKYIDKKKQKSFENLDNAWSEHNYYRWVFEFRVFLSLPTSY